MKRSFSMIVFVAMSTLSFASHAESSVRHVQVRGDKARDIMEALAASGYKMRSGDEFGSQPITIKSHAITCRYTAAYFPDEWMSDSNCYQGDSIRDKALPNSLSLAKAIGAVAEMEGAAGSRFISVSGVSCVLSYEARAYSCDVSQVTY
jgi:hypothetical protein